MKGGAISSYIATTERNVYYPRVTKINATISQLIP